MQSSNYCLPFLAMSTEVMTVIYNVPVFVFCVAVVRLRSRCKWPTIAELLYQNWRAYKQ
jgi:hypothetical protein